MFWEEDCWCVAFNTEHKLQRPVTQPQWLLMWRCRCAKPLRCAELHRLIEIYDSVKSLLELDWTCDSFPPNQSVWAVWLSRLVFHLRNRAALQQWGFGWDPKVCVCVCVCVRARACVCVWWGGGFRPEHLYFRHAIVESLGEGFSGWRLGK